MIGNICENPEHGLDARSTGHMTSTECGLIAQEANVGNLVLTHLPQFGDLQKLKIEAAKEYKGNIVLAKEGLMWCSDRNDFTLR